MLCVLSKVKGIDKNGMSKERYIILTPLGEEFVFRGVIANTLNRYGAWAGVVGSAAVFGIVHGFNVILFDAFMVGILTGILFLKTNSIWPGVVVHIMYNALNLLYYSTL